MTKKISAHKTIKSFRLSNEGLRQLNQLAIVMGRSESNVIEVAIDRMYRDDHRLGRTDLENSATTTDIALQTSNK